MHVAHIDTVNHQRPSKEGHPVLPARATPPPPRAVAADDVGELDDTVVGEAAGGLPVGGQVVHQRVAPGGRGARP